MTPETTTPAADTTQDALRGKAEGVQRRALEAKMAAATPLIDALMRRGVLADQVAAAQAELADVDSHLAALHRDAKKAGWSDTELAAASLDVPKDARSGARRRGTRHAPRRRTTREAVPSEPDGAPATD